MTGEHKRSREAPVLPARAEDQFRATIEQALVRRSLASVSRSTRAGRMRRALHTRSLDESPGDSIAARPGVSDETSQVGM